MYCNPKKKKKFPIDARKRDKEEKVLQNEYVKMACLIKDYLIGASALKIKYNELAEGKR